MTLLQHAVEVELDGHTQTGVPLHVDVTAYLLARGGDPLASSVGGGVGSALYMARVGGRLRQTAVPAGPDRASREPDDRRGRGRHVQDRAARLRRVGLPGGTGRGSRSGHQELHDHGHAPLGAIPERALDPCAGGCAQRGDVLLRNTQPPASTRHRKPSAHLSSSRPLESRRTASGPLWRASLLSGGADVQRRWFEATPATGYGHSAGPRKTCID
ncbi:hypothetical protein EV648_103228 [Kribbella sp. VKM Ac-2568]|nr:hypothetical protein EV648_103228 [Kribbella sp. VKM Ac-2568]